MIDLMKAKASKYVKIVKLSEKNVPDSFSVSIQEYEHFVKKNALEYQHQYITQTYLLLERKTKLCLGYISLICDLLSFTEDEKKISELETVPFSSFPALKIGQLATNENFKNEYCHVGSFLIDFAADVAFRINEEFAACRFLTVDADIENNPTVDCFYEKNGFQPLQGKNYTKKTKIRCMYKDIINFDYSA